MPRIAIIDHEVSAGGVERFLHGLVGGLLQQADPEEWQIDLLLWPVSSGRFDVRWPEHLRAPNLRLWSFSQPLSKHPVGRTFARWRLWHVLRTGFFRTRLQRRLVRIVVEEWVKEQGFDLVYFSYPFGMLCPRLEVPIVATPHDFNYKSAFTTMTPNNQRVVNGLMPGWMARSHTLLVSSNFIAGELAHFYPQAAHKTRVVRLGIPDAPTPPTPAEVQATRERLGLPAEFILTVGWIMQHKNQGILFEALARLRAEGRQVSLVLVGPNSAELAPDATPAPESYVAEVAQRARAHGFELGRDFFALGYVSNEELEALYRSTRLLAMPTLYEAGSFPIREALRLGCPVVASSIPVLEEENALLGGTLALFDPHDAGSVAAAIAATLDDPEGAARRTAAAQARVREIFDWAKTADGYLDIFQQAMADGAPAPA